MKALTGQPFQAARLVFRNIIVRQHFWFVALHLIEASISIDYIDRIISKNGNPFKIHEEQLPEIAEIIGAFGFAPHSRFLCHLPLDQFGE